MRRFFVLVFILMALVLCVACGDKDNALRGYSEDMEVPPSVLSQLGYKLDALNVGLYEYTGKSAKTVTFRVLQSKTGKWVEMETFQRILKPGSYLLCDVNHGTGAYVLKVSYADEEEHWEMEIPLGLTYAKTDGYGSDYLSEKIDINSEACILSFDMSPYGYTESYVYSISEYPKEAPKSVNQRILTIDIQ